MKAGAACNIEMYNVNKRTGRIGCNSDSRIAQQ